MELIHYGATKFNKDLFLPINNEWVKPRGGLWTSPVNSFYGWIDWCNDNDFRGYSKENNFRLQLIEGSKIFIIDCESDLHKAPFLPNCNYIDFEMLSKEYDAIHLTDKGQQETRLSHPIGLYDWDVESVLIINSNCIMEIN